MNEWEWHGVEDRTEMSATEVAGGMAEVGTRVRLRPSPRGDIMDIALAGKIATVESIEEDYEGKIHFAVVIDDDPGRDLGFLRQPGHRFFFDASELELHRGEAEGSL